MKLLEKIKNTFFEEEYIEVEEPEVKEPVVAKKIEPKEPKKEVAIDIMDQPTSIEESNYSDSNLVKKDSKLPYFEDEDFVDDVEKNIDSNITNKKETKKIYGTTPEELYSSINYSASINTSKTYNQNVKEAFKPTPIISPIYGVLDKNYSKDEVIDRRDKPASYVSRKNADLDSVRRKAYGEISPLEDMQTINTDNSKVDDLVSEDNLLYDMTTDNSTPSVDKVTLADAEEYFNDLGLEYNIDYKDNRYEKATGRRVSNNTAKDTKTKDDLDDANLDSNLFDLIDSMYEEGDE